MALEAHSSGVPDFWGPWWYLGVVPHLCVCTCLTLRSKTCFLTGWNALLTILTKISQLVQTPFVSHITKNFPSSASTHSSFREIFLLPILCWSWNSIVYPSTIPLMSIHGNHICKIQWQDFVCLNDSHMKWIDSNHYITDIQNSVLQTLFHYTGYTASLIAKWIYLYQVILTKIVVIKPEIYLA